MRAKVLYWILVTPAIIMSWFTGTFVHDPIVVGLVMALFFLPPISLVLKYKPNGNVQLISPRVMKFVASLRKHFMKWAIYNMATFAFLSVFYVPYQIWFIQLSGAQFWRWFLTTGFLGSGVNIIMRPYVSWITHFLDRRYGKKVLNTQSLPSVDGEPSK